MKIKDLEVLEEKAFQDWVKHADKMRRFALLDDEWWEVFDTLRNRWIALATKLERSRRV